MEPEEQFRLLAGMALVDGVLQAPEERLLLRSAEQLGISPARAHEVVRELAAGGRVSQLTPPADPEERTRLFRALVELAAADGTVTPQEQGVLQRLAGSFGVHPGRVPQLVELALASAVGVAGAAASAPSAPAPSAQEVEPAGSARPTGVLLRRPTRRKPKPPPAPPSPQRPTGTASCPSCGAPVEFKNSRSVAVVCSYCDTTLVRDDAGRALEDVGKVSNIVPDASPIQLGARGECFGVEFAVLGRLQVVHATGFWNEWYLEWADRRTGWLGEALGQYFVTFPSAEPSAEGVLPAFDDLEVGQRVMLSGKRYVVTEVRRARATGTEGETPFVVHEGYELPYADLRRPDDGFATIDYSEHPPLLFTGRCVGWRALNMRGYRRFDGWRA